MRVIIRLDISNPVFIRTFTKLSPSTLKEARKIMGELILVDMDNAPAKLHLHSLVNKSVISAIDKTKKVPVYTIHITSNDSHKASFTYENGTAFFRVCGAHDDIDKNP